MHPRHSRTTGRRKTQGKALGSEDRTMANGLCYRQNKETEVCLGSSVGILILTLVGLQWGNFKINTGRGHISVGKLTIRSYIRARF
jgi:hypothetical protein